MLKQKYNEPLMTRFKKICIESKKRSDNRVMRAVYIAVKEQILCRFGTSRFDYFTCDLYKYSFLGRREFLNTRKAKIIQDICNKPEDCIKFRDKSMFNSVFGDYIHRDWVDTRVDNFDKFSQFVGKHQKFMVKPQFLDGGRGIHELAIEEGADLEKLYSRLQGEEALLEEIVEQCEELGQFNASSVNTIRIASLLGADNQVHIISGVLRMGTRSHCADNFHTHGIAATVDIETGIVISSAISRDLKRYYIHPQSKKQIIGYRVPMWDKVIEAVKQAALIVPEVRYVGWDIAIGKNGEIIFIEGNDNASRDVQQMPDQKGKWLIYKPLLEELKAR